MDFTKLAKDRYSCKKYSDRPVPDEILAEILEAGRLAPTAKNNQPQHIYILRSEESHKKVDELTPCRYGAPIVAVIAYDKNNIYHYPGDERDSGVEDVAIVATHMMLAAASLGVNTCWLNFFDPDKLARSLGLPEDQVVVMLLDIGYAADDAGPLPNHFLRRDIADEVTYL